LPSRWRAPRYPSSRSGRPHRRDVGLNSLYVRDPDGNLVELSQAIDS
jgi:catechol 2,3-dioxygenase-like lactoylglutathione lyase family enzyme